MDSSQRRVQPLENGDKRANSEIVQPIRRQMISSNNFLPTLGSKKTTGPAQIEQLDNVVCYFCGGANCKKEQAQYNKNKNAIEGLHSDWITDNILAMQRPSSKLFPIILPQFKHHNIKAIINLQQQGEHAQCGPGIIPSSGFSYNPEELSSASINFFNYGWEDLTAETSIENLMRICSSFEMCLRQGQKVAVHCHAGTGRTGVAVVSWLIYGERMTAEDAIKLFQLRRRGSLSKTSQRDLLKNFEKFLQNRKWFNYAKISSFHNEEIIQQQNKYAIGQIKSQTKYLPAPLFIVINKFTQLLESKIITSQDVFKSFVGDNENSFILQEVKQLKQEFDQHNYQVGQFKLRSLAQLIFEYFDGLPWQCINDKLVFDFKNCLNQNQNILEFITTNIKEIGLYLFSILQCIVTFTKLLIEKDKNFDTRLFLIRFSISLLQKQQYMDECFFENTLIRTDKIEIPQVIYLFQFLQKWIECDQTIKMFEETQFFRDLRRAIN